MDKYILTFDFGSGSVKAALFNEKYELAGSGNEEYQTYFPKNGWAEQKPLEQWEAMAAVSGKILKKTKIAPEKIIGIAIAQTATSVIFTDECGNAMTDCVMWMDGRAEKQAEEINEKLGEKRFNGKNVISKLLWFEENEPETIENASYMLDLSAYLFHKMTGEFAYEFTGARATCLLDIENRCWDQKMFDLIGFPRRLVPERVAMSTEMIGKLTEEAAEKTGLAAGTPVFGGTSDHAAAILGTGCIRPKDAHIYMGTSAWLAVVTSKDDPNPGRMPSPVPEEKYHFYDTDSGGACLNFLADVFYKEEQEQGKDVFAIIGKEVLESMADGRSEEVLFLPFLAGASAPISDVHVRASLLNLKRSTKRRDIARAFFEGICFNMRLMRDIHAAENGWNVNFLRVVGGVFANTTLPQMLADVLETPVTVLKNPRLAGVLGLAACVDIGLNGKDFSVLDEIAKEEKTYIPKSDCKERYNRLYGLYREAYTALKNVYLRLNA